MSLQWPSKDPEDFLDFTLDFSLWLNGDVVSAATVTVDNLTTQSLSVQKVDYSNGLQVITWFIGGISGENAVVHIDAVTALGRTKQVTVMLPIEDN
jgi:hypothetical protein